MMSGGFFLPRLTPEDPAAAYTVESTRYYCVDRRPGLNFKSGRLDQFLIEEVLRKASVTCMTQICAPDHPFGVRYLGVTPNQSLKFLSHAPP